MLRDDVFAKIKLLNYSPETFKAYWGWIERYLRFSKKNGEWIRPENMREPEVESFLTHLAVKGSVPRRLMRSIRLLQPMVVRNRRGVGIWKARFRLGSFC